MSKLIATSAIDGATAWVARADHALAQAIAAKGEQCAVSFPNTAYFLPILYSFTGEKPATLGALRAALTHAKQLLPARPSDNVWLPYLGGTLDAGVAALFACEVIEACKYVVGPNPADGIWLGAPSDVIMRERGIEFVDGTAPGFAAITGAAPTVEIAVAIAKELQQKNLYVFMGGASGGVQFAEQLAQAGVQLGWETRLVPFGKDVSALAYALGFANRAALSFGGVKPGDFAANLRYNKNRIFAFVLALGEVTPDKYAVAAGAINYGFPVIADSDIPQILPSGVCTYEHVVSNVPHASIVEKALEVRGCKVKVTRVPIPVAYGAAFEGERIRKTDVQVEFGGNRTTAFEFVTTVGLTDIEDGVVEIVGPDIDTVEPGDALPLAIWVEVAGRKMAPEFEPILERQIHHLVNGAEGIWHMGQRDLVWTRVSQAGYARGLRLRHYGDILHAKLLADYPAIVDKVKVTLVTDKAEVERRVAVARKVYDERNRRLASMTDESVETFYSCLLCQSFAPNHVCIITPERLGLCGAYNWLDGRAAYEIDETGPNQPVKKGACIDPVRGIWQGIDEYVYVNSHKTVASMSAYSIMEQPMTSCGCFEVICAYVPECNGIMAVNREFQGDTPVGMSFSTLAGSVGGGQQTPGFMGVGKTFLTSRKFIAAEGGHRRIVWMPRELKEQLKADLQKIFDDIGAPGLLDQVADETVATDAEAVRTHMERVKHPALAMDDLGLVINRGTEGAGAQPVATPVSAPEVPVVEAPAPVVAQGVVPTAPAATTVASGVSMDLLSAIRQVIAEEIDRRMGGMHSTQAPRPADTVPAQSVAGAVSAPEVSAPVMSTSERISHVKRFAIGREKAEVPVWEVVLGATAAQGGTRGRTLTVGGHIAMPFHGWEGRAKNRALVALEVFDSVSTKYPAVLRAAYGDILGDPAAMARKCVREYGADLISVRLDGTHPERGGRTAQQAVETVKAVLSAVDVPLIVTGHSHFATMNEIMKAVAQGCAGERLLLSWVEQENYRTIAGAAMAYGHCVVSQSPIDVNIAKQMNILLTGMDVKREQIVMDPLTGASGYGIEYTYSVMERIRMTALGGDAMLAGPMLVYPGAECAKIKELRSTEAEMPTWGDLSKRAAMWEIATATSLLYAGADILVMGHPEAARRLRQTIDTVGAA